MALLCPRLNRVDGKRKNNKTDELSATFFFRSKISSFSVTLGLQLIKTSSCRVGTQTKQACSARSGPTHNFKKRYENYAMP